MIRGAPVTAVSSTNGKPSALRQGLAVLLSLGLALFLVDAMVSLADDSLILFLDLHILSGLRGILFFFTVLMSLLLYGSMAITPMIPKRWFVPLALFGPVALLLSIPLLIYFSGHSHRISWAISLCQVFLGLGILYMAQGGWKLRWPVVSELQLTGRGFSWRNLVGFVALNLFVLLPAAFGYLAFSASTAVNHYSEGFMALRPSGFIVQARTYARDDGKTIHLYPMAHIGDASFYRQLTESFPTNSLVLMEGVMDRNNLLTNKPSYKRMATSLGLSDQQKEFKPSPGGSISADMDVSEFAPETIEMINLIMLIHANGLTPETIAKITQYSPSPGSEKRLWEDILTKRNRHLLGEIDSGLLRSDTIVVPWGAAHMPEIAREIQKKGFRVTKTRDFVVIGFGSAGSTTKTALQEE